METNSILEHINSIIFEDGDINALVKRLKEDYKEDNKEKLETANKCRDDFGVRLWSFLGEGAREHIVSSVIAIRSLTLNHADTTCAVSVLARSLEDEMREKIFDEFNSIIRSNIDDYDKNYDIDYVDGIKKNYVGVPLMLSKLRYVGNDYAGGIASKLRRFIIEDWNVNLLSQKERIDEAFSFAKYRTDNSHTRASYDIKDYVDAKNKAIKVLAWFARSYKHY